MVQIFSLKLEVILNVLGSHPKNYQISHRVQGGMYQRIWYTIRMLIRRQLTTEKAEVAVTLQS